MASFAVLFYIAGGVIKKVIGEASSDFDGLYCNDTMETAINVDIAPLYWSVLKVCVYICTMKSLMTLVYDTNSSLKQAVLIQRFNTIKSEFF